MSAGNLHTSAVFPSTTGGQYKRHFHPQFSLFPPLQNYQSLFFSSPLLALITKLHTALKNLPSSTHSYHTDFKVPLHNEHVQANSPGHLVTVNTVLRDGWGINKAHCSAAATLNDGGTKRVTP